VILTFVREGMSDPFEVTLVRKQIDIPVLDTEIIDTIFIIHLYSFNTHAVDAFKQALQEFNKNKDTYKGMIIDMRSNPGGFFEASIDIASMFLPVGTVIVRERGGEASSEHVYRSYGTTMVADTVPLVVLVDAGSASASEILAGALQENKRATLVGTHTFGKGSVQEFLYLSDQSSLKVTIARWYTPGGVSISEGGLAPDIEVPVLYDDVKKGYDKQLEKALQILAEKPYIE
jgi:carboxyl-terminal processing protease